MAPLARRQDVAKNDETKVAPNDNFEGECAAVLKLADALASSTIKGHSPGQMRMALDFASALSTLKRKWHIEV